MKWDFFSNNIFKLYYVCHFSEIGHAPLKLVKVNFESLMYSRVKFEYEINEVMNKK